MLLSILFVGHLESKPKAQPVEGIYLPCWTCENREHVHIKFEI